MAVVALGYPVSAKYSTKCKDLFEVLLKNEAKPSFISSEVLFTKLSDIIKEECICVPR